MSWFTQQIEHPFVSAMKALASNPAIANNPAAAAAVTQAQAEAAQLVTVATATAQTAVAAAAVSADPIVGGFEGALTAAADAALTAAIPAEAFLAVPVANSLLTLLFARGHDLLTALEATAKAKIAAPRPAG